MVASQIVIIVTIVANQAASPVVVSAPREVTLSTESAKRFNAIPTIIVNALMAKNSFVQRVKSSQVHVLKMNLVKCMKMMASS